MSDKTLSCESPNQTIALTGGQYKDFKITGSGSSANNCEIQLSGVFNIAGDFDISITNSSTQVVATDAVFFMKAGKSVHVEIPSGDIYSASSVQLSSSTQGDYAGVLFWWIGNGASKMEFKNGEPNNKVTFSGITYAPDANLQIERKSLSRQSVTLKGLVGNAVTVTNRPLLGGFRIESPPLLPAVCPVDMEQEGTGQQPGGSIGARSRSRLID